MWGDILRVFLQSGLPGASVAALGYVVYRLWMENKDDRDRHAAKIKERDAEMADIQRQRLVDTKELFMLRFADAESIHRQMLDVVKQCTTVMETTSSSLNGHREATIEHREAQKEAAEELRKLSTLLMSLNEELRNSRLRQVK